MSTLLSSLATISKRASDAAPPDAQDALFSPAGASEQSSANSDPALSKDPEADAKHQEAKAKADALQPLG